MPGFPILCLLTILKGILTVNQRPNSRFWILVLYFLALDGKVDQMWAWD